MQTGVNSIICTIFIITYCTIIVLIGPYTGLYSELATSVQRYMNIYTKYLESAYTVTLDDFMGAPFELLKLHAVHIF